MTKTIRVLCLWRDYRNRSAVHISTLARRAEVCERTVRRWMVELYDYGYAYPVDRERGGWWMMTDPGEGYRER